MLIKAKLRLKRGNSSSKDQARSTFKVVAILSAAAVAQDIVTVVVAVVVIVAAVVVIVMSRLRIAKIFQPNPSLQKISFSRRRSRVRDQTHFFRRWSVDAWLSGRAGKVRLILRSLVRLPSLYRLI